MKFLILLAQHHEDFRAMELQSIAEMESIDVDLSGYRKDSPFLEVELASESEAQRLVQRSFLTRAVYRVYAQGPTVDVLHARNRETDFQHLMGKSFKVEFSSFQGTRNNKSQLEQINELEYMALDGPIRMKNPDVRLTFVESYRELDPTTPEYIWFTELTAESSRPAIDTYDLKKRRNVGTTSFEAELAFVTTNMAQIRKGDIVYDPFSGTGSFPLAAAFHGASVIASDIDIRPLRKYRPNFAQYHTESRLLDALEMDFTHNALHPRIKLDAIICDPPYGVRERIVVCGAAKPDRFVGKEHVMVGDELSHRRRDYIATKKPYDLSMMLKDLLEFAADRLEPGRRLAFWLPLDEEEVHNTKVPLHRDLEFKHFSTQKFSKWERWLLTYQRRPIGETGPELAVSINDDFRERYFARYNR